MNETFEELRKQKIEELRKGKVKLRFTKLNGDIREMNGTLNKELILENYPEFTEPKGKKTSKSSNIILWDLDKKGWRSLKIHNLIET